MPATNLSVEGSSCDEEPGKARRSRLYFRKPAFKVAKKKAK